MIAATACARSRCCPTSRSSSKVMARSRQSRRRSPVSSPTPIISVSSCRRTFRRPSCRPSTWFEERHGESETLKKYATANGALFAPAYGDEAQQLVGPAIRTTAWQLQDGGKAKVPRNGRHPETVAVCLRRAQPQHHAIDEAALGRSHRRPHLGRLRHCRRPRRLGHGPAGVARDAARDCTGRRSRAAWHRLHHFRIDPAGSA